MTDVALKEYLEALIEVLRREIAIQREADMKALAIERDNLRNTIRVDTLKWIVSAIVGAVVAVFTALAFWKR